MSSDYAFSPLALTQVLPFLPLSQATVDYEVGRRDDPNLINNLLRNPKAQVLLARGGQIAVPRGQGKIATESSVKLRAAMLPAAYFRDFVLGAQRDAQKGAHEGTKEGNPARVCMIFLGSSAGVSYLALSVPRSAQPPAVGSFLERVYQRFDWVDLRDFAPRASALEAGLATSAVTVGGWQEYQHFCPQCGAPTSAINSGWAQRCTNPEHDVVIFPRIEPAVITAVVDRDDRLLLQHNVAWKRPRLLSVSAGFVEVGESLEHAVRRETMEEVGIELGDVTYMGSQPWPFQRSLMVAFKARALTTDIHVDGVEVERASWMSRDDFSRALAAGEFELPTQAAVARYQIQEWFGQIL